MDIIKVTKDTYEVPASEKHLYHVKQELTEFDRSTGKRMSRPVIQKYGKRMFESVVYDDLKAQGYTIEVLHDPNEWLKAEAERKQTEAELARINAEAEAQAAKEAEKEALKAKILAELKEQGIIPSNDGSSKRTRN